MMVALPDRPHNVALPPRPQSDGRHDDGTVRQAHRPDANGSGTGAHTVATNDQIGPMDAVDVVASTFVSSSETVKEAAAAGLMSYADKHWDPHTDNPTTGQRLAVNAIDAYEGLEDKAEALSSKFIEEPLDRLLNWVFGKLGGSSGDDSDDNAQSSR